MVADLKCGSERGVLGCMFDIKAINFEQIVTRFIFLLQQNYKTLFLSKMKINSP